MTEIPKLEIDMDKECERCHEMGATPSGLCLECIAEGLKKAKYQAIGILTIQKAKSEICAMLDEYHEEIDKAYVKAERDLAVALSVKLTPMRLAGEIELVVGINFVESRIKHAVKLVVNEKQMKIPGV